MAISLLDVRRIIHPQKKKASGGTLKILDTWTEYGDGGNTNERKLEYLCYEMETIDPHSGERHHFYKAIKLARIIRIPKGMKQSTALMDMQTQVMTAIYEQEYNFICVIANIREPVALGLLFLYGVQGVSATLDGAKEKCRSAFVGLSACLQGTYRVLEMRIINAQETEWLRDKLFNMEYASVVRGIPKASKTGEDIGNKGMGGSNLNPDSQGTLEELITGMADYEYVIEILTTPVHQSALRDWAAVTRRQMTDWQEQMQGTKGFNLSLSIPMMYGANQGSSAGTNKGYTVAESYNVSQGTNVSQSYGENVGQALSQSYGQSYGKAYGQSFSESISQTHTVSQGVTMGRTVGMSFGISQGQSVGQNVSQSQSFNQGQSQNMNVGRSFGESVGQNQSLSQSQNIGQSFGVNRGVSSGFSQGQSVGQSIGTSQGQSISMGRSVSAGQSYGVSSSEGRSQGYSLSQGTSIGQSFGQSQNMGQSIGSSRNVSHGMGYSQNYSEGMSKGISQNMGTSYGTNQSQSMNANHSIGASTNQSVSSSQSAGMSTNVGHSTGQTFGMSQGKTLSENESVSQGQSVGSSHGFNSSDSVANGQTWGNSMNVNNGSGQSHTVGNTDTESYNRGNIATGAGEIGSYFAGPLAKGAGTLVSGFVPNESHAHNDSNTTSQNTTLGTGANAGGSLTNSHSAGESSGVSESSSTGYSYGQGSSVSESMSQSQNSSYSESAGSSYSESIGRTQGVGQSESYSAGYGRSVGESYGVNQSTGMSQSVSNSRSEGMSQSYSMGEGMSNSMNMSQGTSYGQNYGESRSSGMTTGMSQSMGQNWGQSMSESNSQSVSQNVGQSTSQSMSQNVGQNYSQSLGQSEGSSYGMSQGQTTGASYGQNIGMSESHGVGTTIGQSIGLSKGYSVSTNVGTTQTKSESQSYSVSQSESWSTSHGFTKGESYTESTGESVSNGQTQSYGQSKGISQGQSTSTGRGTSQSQNIGYSQGITQGASASMGIAPSLGYSKSYQWLDQQVKDIVEMLEFKNERIKNALRGSGAFYSYVYIACPNMDALAAAKMLAKSSWQNEEAMIEPLQVLDLDESEQQNIMTHCMGFSAEVSMEDPDYFDDYKYCTVLLPKEMVSYTHLPRVSEGGLFVEVGDVPKFSVPSMLKGEIYMGTILSAERYTMQHGYETPFQYRIDERELMHMYFTGSSRSGKTVTAMRFVAELTRVRRKSTGKRLRIVCMDPKQDWRALARYVEPERFHFYNMGNTLFRPLHLNPLKIPHGVIPQMWIDGVIDIYCRAYGLLERGKQMLGETIYQLYHEAGVFGYTVKQRQDLVVRYKDEYFRTTASSPNDPEAIRLANRMAEERIERENTEIKQNKNPELISQLSAAVTFVKVYDRMNLIKLSMEGDKDAEEEIYKLTGQKSKGKSGNDTKDAYARLLDRLQAFNREFSVERQLFGREDGMSVDELIGADDVTVIESKGLENTFRNFIFGVITSGFYKFALAHEGGFLADDQYETLLVIEEANEVLTGSDVAGTGGGASFGMTGESEFEQILDQSAGYGLFICAITQKISDMPKSIIANAGLIFAGRLKIPDDITTVIRSIAREERYEDRDLVKWFPRSPTGWFICMSSRTFDFKDSEPVLVKISPLNTKPPTNSEIDELLTLKQFAGIT